MEYQGKKICGIKIIDESNGNKVIVSMCDAKTETTNGYKIVIDPYSEEVKAND